jgi:type 1 fimbriae regulatory protein FimB
MIKQARRDYLRADEIEKLLCAAKRSRNPERNFALVLVMFRHALRVSEACALRLSDLNLEIAELFIRRAKGSKSGSHPVFNGETTALKSWLAVRDKMDVATEVDSLFVSEQRKPLNRVSVWYLIKGLAREAGLDDVRVHSLRHSCGYYLTNEGKDLRLIQDFMGHASVNSTIRYTCVNTRRFSALFR